MKGPIEREVRSRRWRKQVVQRWQRFCVAIIALLLTSFFPSSLLRAATAPADRQAELLARAAELTREHNDPAAAKLYEQVLASDPASLEALNDLGVAYSRMEKYHEAAHVYERALRLDPSSFPLLLNLGIVRFKGGDLRAAAGPLSKAVSLDPGNFQARSLLAMAYFGAKNYKNSAAQFEKLVAARPSNATLQYLLAESYLHSGQDEKLLDYFQQLLRSNPRSVTVDMLMGEADDGLDRTDEAISEFKAAAALDPNHPNVNFGLGYLYWKNRQYGLAAESFQKEITAGGDVAKSDAYLADIALKRGQRAEARALAEEAIRRYPNIRIAHFDLGILDADARDYASAEREFKEAIRLAPTRVEARYRLAQLYRAEGKNALAQAEIKQVAQIHNKHADKLLDEISGPPAK